MVNNHLTIFTAGCVSAASIIVVETYFHLITDGINGQIDAQKIAAQMFVLSNDLSK
jgi:hypothetical protein